MTNGSLRAPMPTCLSWPAPSRSGRAPSGPTRCRPPGARPSPAQATSRHPNDRAAQTSGAKSRVDSLVRLAAGPVGRPCPVAVAVEVVRAQAADRPVRGLATEATGAEAPKKAPQRPRGWPLSGLVVACLQGPVQPIIRAELISSKWAPSSPFFFDPRLGRAH
jgi:hypothetical protein